MEDFRQNKDGSYTWMIPRAVVESIYQGLVDQGKVIIPRVLTITLIIEFALYTYMQAVLPDHIELMEFKSSLLKIFSIVFLAVVGLLFAMFVVSPNISRRLKKSRLITKKGFQVSDTYVYWKQVTGYWVEDLEEFPGLKQIIFRTKRRVYRISLPVDRTHHDEILQFLDSHTSRINPDYPEPRPVFSKYQLLSCWGFTIAATVLAAFIFQSYSLRQHILLFMIGLLTTPGTFAIALVLGKKFYKDKRFPFAFVLNMAAFMLFMVIIIFAESYKYHLIIESYTP